MGRLCDKASKDWWEKVKLDQNLINDWLEKQYRGEVLASRRISEVFGAFDLSDEDKDIILKICKEEELHAKWIAKLLSNRGIQVEYYDKASRYWEHTFKDMDTLEDAAAVAHLAESMRLSRIQAIAEDVTAPYDIRKVMQRIYKDELGHSSRFKLLSKPDAIVRHMDNHMAGLAALGLVV